MADKPAPASSERAPAAAPGASPTTTRGAKGGGAAAPPSAGLLPALSLPKGGGAIRGIGEKFSTNPATGTSSLSVPIATSPGRAGFELGLQLGYDSGGGNGPFGVGWSLSVPMVTRKTDKGLPRYADAGTQAGLPDVYVMSGAEDLVPVRLPSGSGTRPDVIERGAYRVERHRPRTEGLYARIERWVHTGSGDVHWRATTKDNVLSVYGRTAQARIADPEHPERVFSWLLEETRDDRGNAVRYAYKGEDGAGVSPTKTSEENRFEVRNGVPHYRATAQRYLKRIQYGNRTPLLDREAPLPTAESAYLFEAVLDYGEHDDAIPTPAEARAWPVRPDAFSTYRAAFEVRTLRLCRRVLMFHRFAELGPAACLVRSTDFSYDEGPTVTYLIGATQTGYSRAAGATAYQRASLPTLQLGYRRAEVHDQLRTVEADSLSGIPAGIEGSGAQWVDLDGEGISGVLIPTDGAWFYKANLGSGQLAPPALLRSLPSPADLGEGGQQFADLDGDGHLELVSYSPPLAGSFSRTAEDGWAPFVALPNLPQLDWNDPNLRFLDLDGDGFPDVLITEHEAFWWYRSRGKDGFDPAVRLARPQDEREGPAVIFADGTETIQLADLSGDGMMDLVRVRNGEVSYWPNLGHGRFGRKVTLDQRAAFDDQRHFDPKRVRFADLDGSGPSDVVYLHRDGVRLHFNHAGNALSDPTEVRSLPPVDPLTSVGVTDLLGNGTACLVWSSPLPGNQRRPLAYVDLMNGQKPHLLESVVNHLGAETRMAYASSTKFYLRDKAAGQPWLTRLAFPVHVLERVEHLDRVTGARMVTRFAYHHGYFDGVEREFHGFACAEQWDAESFGGDGAGASLFPELPYDVDPADPALNLPPVRMVTWFHTGAWLEREHLERELAKEYYQGDPFAPILPDTILPAGLMVREEREAARALRGQILRQETYAEDSTPASPHPYKVSERNHQIRLLQRAEGNANAVFCVHPRHTLELHYERNPSDPRIQHELVLEVDDFGNTTRSAAIAYPRRVPIEPEQARLWATTTENTFANHTNEPDWYRASVPIATVTSELTGLSMPAQGVLSIEQVVAVAAAATEIPYEAVAGTGLQRRVIQREHHLYYREYEDIAGYRQDSQGPLELGQISMRALPHQTYKQALTPGLIAQVYGARVTDTMLQQEGRYVLRGDTWWISSGRTVVDPQRFFVPMEALDPFGAWSAIEYDSYSLLPTATKAPRVAGEASSGQVETTDPRFGSISRVTPDYRVLIPSTLTDHNENRTAVELDALGMVIKTAVLGKAGEGEGDTIAAPTTRLEYDLHRWHREHKPAFVKTFVREQHGAANPRWQEAYSYSDGHGHEVMKKIQAEPEPATTTRWIGTGRTIFDNKGNAIKKYEPFFSTSFDYEDEASVVEQGVTPIYRYDPLGRLIRTDHPNQTISRVEFATWNQESWDENDAILGTPWLESRQGRPPGDPERRAADLTTHHAGTPGIVHFDALSRIFLSVADNGGTDKHRTRILLDIEGNQRAITDARGNQTLVQAFDMLGRKIRVITADAGETRTLLDVESKAIRAWDGRGHVVRKVHDALQRPTHIFVSAPSFDERLAERVVYGENHPQARALNLRGQEHLSYDSAGAVSSVRFDFKGNLLESTRRLGSDPHGAPNWIPLAHLEELTVITATASSLLEGELFSTTLSYDALNRVVARVTPDASEVRFTYNEANLPERIETRVRGGATWTMHVANIDYDARGQRTHTVHGNGATTSYTYDASTFRLTRLRTLRSSDGLVLQNLEYTYDPVGNVLEVRDRADWMPFVAREPVSGDGRYRYDALYRLIEAEGREHPGQQPTDAEPPRSSLPHPNDAQALRRYAEQYTYDEVGNLRSIAHQSAAEQWRRRYVYAAGDNRLLATSAPSDLEGGTPSHTYGYDGHGNMTRMPHLTQMRWDFEDRLEYVNRGGGGEVFFTYDSQGQRVRKLYEHSGLIEERIYLGDFEIYRRRRASEPLPDLVRESLHVMDGHRRIVIVETKSRDVDAPTSVPSTRHRYQLDNHLGSVNTELDAAGRVISYEEFFPFGGTSFHASQTGLDISLKRYRYTGKERDEETGLYYHGARYYAPWLARWTSPDPAGLVDGTNIYAYVRNNPLALSDPTGMWGWKEVAVIAAVVVVGTIVTVATAGAAAPLIAGAVASIGLTGTAATVATGVAVGAVAGAVGGAAAGAAGEGTRQAVHGERLNAGRIARAAGDGAVTGAAIGAAIPLATAALGAAATTTAGAAVVGTVARVARGVANSGVGRGVATATRTVAQAPGVRQVVAGTRSVAQTTGRGLQAVEQAGQNAGIRTARGLTTPGSRGAEAVERFAATRSIPLTSAATGTERSAAVLNTRAAELQSSRRAWEAERGTTAVIRGQHRTTGEVRDFVATEGATQPRQFGPLRPGEEFVQGAGHAEQTIIGQRGAEWNLFAGGSSRNVCSNVCQPMVESNGLSLGGSTFPGRSDKTPFRMFWRQ